MDVGALVARLNADLQASRVEEALAALATLLDHPLVLNRAWPLVEKEFTDSGHVGAMLSWLEEEGNGADHYLVLAGKAASLASAAGDPALAERFLLPGRPAGETLRWTNTDRLKRYLNLGWGALPKLYRLKYGVDPSTVRDGIFAFARTVSGQLDLDPVLFEHLFTKRSDRSQTWQDWFDDVKTAHALDHLLQDDIAFDLKAILDERATADVKHVLAGTNGCLVVSFHGSFLAAATKLFHDARPDGLRLASRPTPRPNLISAKDDPAAAVFAILRSIEDGKAVFMNPDAQLGKRGGIIEVADLDVAVAEGGAFVAAETGCPTYWLTVVRNGAKLVPVLEQGPVRLDGERAKAFKERWLRFYGRCIDHLLRGPADNIVFELGGLSWPLTREAMRQSRKHAVGAL